MKSCGKHVGFKLNPKKQIRGALVPNKSINELTQGRMQKC
jgi:hypothetical protein